MPARLEFLFFLSILFCGILTQTTTRYYIDASIGSISDNCGSSTEPCIGLQYLPSLPNNTQINIAAGTYSSSNNFPYVISGTNITLNGADGVTFNCNTEGRFLCLEIITPTFTSNSIIIQNIQFTGFSINASSVHSMIKITPATEVVSAHALLHNLQSTVQFQTCSFTNNYNLIQYPDFSNSSTPIPPPGTNYHQYHPNVELITIEGVDVSITNSVFSDNNITTIYALVSYVTIDSCTAQNSTAAYNSQFIRAEKSLFIINESKFSSNGREGFVPFINIVGTTCQISGNRNQTTQDCTTFLVNNSEFTNNTLGLSFFQIEEGGSIGLNNSYFAYNSANYSILSAHATISSYVSIENTEYYENNLFAISATFAASSHFSNFNVTQEGESVVSFFLTAYPGSNLQIHNMNFNSALSPMMVIDSVIVVKDSYMKSTSMLVMDASSVITPCSLVFSSVNFIVPGQLITLSGFVSLYFDTCEFNPTNSEGEEYPFLCYTETNMIYFIGEENSGFGIGSESFNCRAYCNDNNEDLCPAGDTLSSDSGSGFDWTLFFLILFILYSVGASLVIALFVYKFLQIRKAVQYSEL